MDTLNRLLYSFGQQLLTVLPQSPLAGFWVDLAIGNHPIIATGLGWLNWFIPVRQILQITAAWLLAVGLYYIYSIIMRWLKVIG